MAAASTQRPAPSKCSRRVVRMCKRVVSLCRYLWLSGSLILAYDLNLFLASSCWRGSVRIRDEECVTTRALLFLSVAGPRPVYRFRCHRAQVTGLRVALCDDRCHQNCSVAVGNRTRVITNVGFCATQIRRVDVSSPLPPSLCSLYHVPPSMPCLLHSLRPQLTWVVKLMVAVQSAWAGHGAPMCPLRSDSNSPALRTAALGMRELVERATEIPLHPKTLLC